VNKKRKEIATMSAVMIRSVPNLHENDVMRQQLEYLIGHSAERGICGCSECRRYLRVRSVLLAIFGEPEPQPSQQVTALRIAA
jgi:hypothetical protein